MNDEHTAGTVKRIAEVALPIPVPKNFDYLIPEIIDTIKVGSLVEVIFSRRRAKGCVVGLREGDAQGLGEVLRHITPEYYVEPHLIELAKWIADYYFCSLGEALSNVSFIGFNDVRIRQKRMVRVRHLEKWQTREQREELPKAQQAVLEQLLTNDNSWELPAALAKAASVSSSTVTTLIKKQLLEEGWHEAPPHDIYAVPVERSLSLKPTQHQQVALERIIGTLDKREPGTFLLFGITGSGKTEIYLQTIEKVLKEGGQAIVLVPEISLTPQTVERFRARLGEVIGVYHSRLSLAERLWLWHRIKAGEIKVLIGPRSAIFAPFPRLRVIVMDEENETAYKQEETPRYHTREVARWLACQHRAVLILGGATPSLESYHAAQKGEFQLLMLPERIGGYPLPQVKLIDLQREMREGEGALILSPTLRQEIKERLKRQEQVLLFLNRRGYYNFMECYSCHRVVRCERCDVTLTYHKPQHLLRCHYCGWSTPVPEQCPYCESGKLGLIGVGTQRVEEEVRNLFPRAQSYRLDSDSIRSRLAIIEGWEEIKQGNVDIILGTQMIAKGLHLERLTLVGVVNADFTLFLPDFRSAERTYSLLVQVAGRSGRSELGGEVFIQTWMPEHYAVVNAVEQDYEAFAEEELRRRQLMRFPPFYQLISLIFAHKEQPRVQQLSERFGNILKFYQRRRYPEQVSIIGPHPSPMSKLRGKYRSQMLLRGRTREPMRQLLTQAFEEFRQVPGHSTVRITVDVDPISVV